MKGKGKILVLIVVVLALSAANAQAELVEIALTGKVAYIDNYSTMLNELFDIGDPISGVYVYEVEPGPGNNASGSRGYWFRSAPYGIKLTVGDFLIQSSPDNPEFLIEILNDRTGMDAYGVRSYSNLPLPNGLSVALINWQLIDYSRAALSGTSLLAEAPVLEDWPDGSGLSISFGYKGGSHVGVKVNSVAVVPEPATLLLFAAGTLALVRRTRL